MIKITIRNLLGTETHGAEWNTQLEANNWIEECVSNNCWGKPERWVREDQEDISAALETREIIEFPAIPEVLDENNNIIQAAVPAQTRTEYKLAAEYTITQEDITAQVAQEQMNRTALAYLASTDWMVIRAAEGGTPVPADVTTARSAARVSIVR